MAKLTIIIELEVSAPFENAEQERYALASIEEALTESSIWHGLLANEETCPQTFSNVNARVKHRAATEPTR